MWNESSIVKKQKLLRHRWFLSLGISFLVHAAIVALLIWGALFFSPVKFGGEGSGAASVDVWLTGPDGGGAKFKSTGPSNSVKQGSAEENAGKENAGDGAGAGSQGSGDGNPTLANIWKRINGRKYYPRLAKERGIEGTPRVEFAIALDGRVLDASISASCGEAILDDAAIETIRRAAPLPFYPGRITVGVKYSLSN